MKTWLTGKVSDVVSEGLITEAVAGIPIFSRIRELNKRELIDVYRCLEQNN
jgi:ATP-dependent protease Clp ATPase subunit